MIEKALDQADSKTKPLRSEWFRYIMRKTKTIKKITYETPLKPKKKGKRPRRRKRRNHQRPEK